MNSITSTRTFSRVTALCLAIGVVASFASLPGFAASKVTVKVSSDPQITYKRLQYAAADICGNVDRHDLARYNAFTRCYVRVLQGAVEQMNQPALLAIHREHVSAGTSQPG